MGSGSGRDFKSRVSPETPQIRRNADEPGPALPCCRCLSCRSQFMEKVVPVPYVCSLMRKLRLPFSPPSSGQISARNTWPEKQPRADHSFLVETNPRYRSIEICRSFSPRKYMSAATRTTLSLSSSERSDFPDRKTNPHLNPVCITPIYTITSMIRCRHFSHP